MISESLATSLPSVLLLIYSLGGGLSDTCTHLQPTTPIPSTHTHNVLMTTYSSCLQLESHLRHVGLWTHKINLTAPKSPLMPVKGLTTPFHMKLPKTTTTLPPTQKAKKCNSYSRHFHFKNETHHFASYLRFRFFTFSRQLRLNLMTCGHLEQSVIFFEIETTKCLMFWHETFFEYSYHWISTLNETFLKGLFTQKNTKYKN